jgi:mannan endo-1,4-beta-mannosidase
MIMKLVKFLTSAICAVASAPIVLAANSFSGSNLYYAAGLTASQQTTLFKGLQSAGVKVLRVWLDGEFGPPISRNKTAVF